MYWLLWNNLNSQKTNIISNKAQDTLLDIFVSVCVMLIIFYPFIRNVYNYFVKDESENKK